MRHGGGRTTFTWQHLGTLLLLGGLTLVAASPRGAMATVRMVSLGAVPQTGAAAPPEMAQPEDGVRFAVAAVVRRRLLGPPAAELPEPDVDGTPPAVAPTVAALLAGWVPIRQRPASPGGPLVSTRRNRGPPLHLAFSG